MRGYCVDGPFAGKFVEMPKVPYGTEVGDSRRIDLDGERAMYFVRLIVDDIAQLWGCAREPNTLTISPREDEG